MGIRFIFKIPRITNNDFVNNIFNLLNVKSLCYKNLLLSFYKFRNNTVDISHIYIMNNYGVLIIAIESTCENCSLPEITY